MLRTLSNNDAPPVRPLKLGLMKSCLNASGVSLEVSVKHGKQQKTLPGRPEQDRSSRAREVPRCSVGTTIVWDGNTTAGRIASAAGRGAVLPALVRRALVAPRGTTFCSLSSHDCSVRCGSVRCATPDRVVARKRSACPLPPASAASGCASAASGTAALSLIAGPDDAEIEMIIGDDSSPAA